MRRVLWLLLGVASLAHAIDAPLGASKQNHDGGNPHAPNFWWKTRSLRAVSPGLLGALPTG